MVRRKEVASPDLVQRQTVAEYQPEGSNPIRVGDIVKVLPSKPKKRDGFEARCQEIRVDDAGEVTELVVVGGPMGRTSATRYIRPSRIKRVAQTRKGSPREMRRG